MADRTQTVAFGRLTPGTTGDADGAPDGALATCQNLRPAPAADGSGYEYEVVGTPSRWFPGVEGVRWGALHVRQRPEVHREAGDPDRRLEATRRVLLVRLVGGVPTLEAYDLDDAGDAAAVPLLSHVLPDAAASERLAGSLVPMGVRCLVVLSAQDAAGEVPTPIAALVVGDEDVEPLGAVPLPRARVTAHATASGGEPGGAPGQYALRACFEFAGGAYGPLGPATFYATPATGGPFTFDVVVETAPYGGLGEAWERRAVGVAVFASVVPVGASGRLAPEMEAATGPWRYVRTVPMETFSAGGATLADLALVGDVLAAAEAHPEGDLAYCGLWAVLGGAALDYPDLVSDVLPAGSGALDDRARIAVEIETQNGLLRRYGPARLCRSGETFQVVGKASFGAIDVAAVTYPDRRAKRLLVYREGTEGADTWELVAEARMRAPAATNLAGTFNGDGDVFTLVAPVAPGGIPHLTTAMMEAENARLDHDPNRVLAGDVGDLLRWPAARSQAVGDGPDDGVMAVAPVAEPASEGQYGDFPLVALTRRGAWLLQIGTALAGEEVFFLGARPLATEGGASGPASACVVRGGRVAVVAASDDGLIPYDPFPRFDLTRLALGGELGPYAAFFADGPALACRVGARGAEVWAASRADDGTHVVAYNLQADAFFTLALDRVGWFEAVAESGAPDRVLVGIDGAGRLWREEASAGVVGVLLETGPLALGLPAWAGAPAAAAAGTGRGRAGAGGAPAREPAPERGRRAGGGSLRGGDGRRGVPAVQRLGAPAPAPALGRGAAGAAAEPRDAPL